MASMPAFLFPALGYLSGSLPFAVWVTRLLKGVDVRDSGSGHATTTNTIRQVGFAAGALVLFLDLAKGFLPVWLILRLQGDDLPAYLVPVTAAMAVAGHCWPLFGGFRGGMGLATAGGSLLAVSPLADVLGLGILVILLLATRHGARASVFTGLLLAPVLWLFGLRGAVFLQAVALGSIIAFRFLIDWNRKYRELWLDRDRPAQDGGPASSKKDDGALE
jgi:glycerol-3-phosphate acyltransferase PlsY